MNFDHIPAGKNPPEDIYVAIEIPANSSPVKYEIDKDMGAVMVDRFMTAPMFYPANYGFIPTPWRTMATPGCAGHHPYPVQPGSVIRCRPVGVLNMEDEAGGDAKLVAVPTTSSPRPTPTSRTSTTCPSCCGIRSSTSSRTTRLLSPASGSRFRIGTTRQPPARPSRSPWPTTRASNSAL